MSPEDKEFYELEFGMVITKEMELDLLLQPLGLTFLTKYHDFLGKTPWARCDN